MHQTLSYESASSKGGKVKRQRQMDQTQRQSVVPTIETKLMTKPPRASE